MPSTKITSTNIGKLLPKIKIGKVIIFYHMDTCYHCQKFKPIWKECLKTIKTPKKNVYEIEANLIEPLIMSGMKVAHGFPSVFVYNNGIHKSEMVGGNTLEDTQKFLLKHLVEK
jgi:hypothetical protein